MCKLSNKFNILSRFGESTGIGFVDDISHRRTQHRDGHKVLILIFEFIMTCSAHTFERVLANVWPARSTAESHQTKHLWLVYNWFCLHFVGPLGYCNGLLASYSLVFDDKRAASSVASVFLECGQRMDANRPRRVCQVGTIGCNTLKVATHAVGRP